MYFSEVSELVQGAVIWFLIWCLPILAVAGFTTFALVLPFQRQLRARLFVDLLETGIKSGHSLEQAIVSISRSGERSVGVAFHLFAAYLEEGIPFMRALDKVPRLVPPQVRAVLRAGVVTGDVAGVLPVCRALLRQGGSQVRAAVNYQVVILFVLNPIIFFVVSFKMVKVDPVLAEIVTGMKLPFPPLLQLTREISGWLMALECVMIVALWLGTIAYLGGPRLLVWLQRGVRPLGDWLVCAVPWKRKRLQCAFSRTLALLLDADVPEARALILAAEATANAVFIERAYRVQRSLEDGAPLIEAVETVDPSGELAWRLRNALRTQNGFSRSLAGWHESLEARAFQQEQAAAHCASSVLLFMNGLLVALLAGSIIQVIAWMGVGPAASPIFGR